MGGAWDIPTICCEPGKWLAKGNPETYHIKVIQVATRVELSPLSLNPTMCVSTHNILFVLQTHAPCFTTFYLLEVLSCKAEGPGLLSLTTGLVVRVWCSHCCGLASVSGWEPKARSKPLQAEATWDQPNSPQICPWFSSFQDTLNIRHTSSRQMKWVLSCTAHGLLGEFGLFMDTHTHTHTPLTHKA